MANVLLVSPEFIRSTTNISNNLQDKYLHSAIRESTDIDLEEVVGTKMLKKLKELVSTGDIQKEENELYKDLLDAAKYFLAYATISRVVVISSAKIDNFGLSQADDEHVQALDMKEVFQLEKYYTNKADVYRKKLQDFIKKNLSNLPEITDYDCYDTEANLNSAASCSIFLGGARGKSYNPILTLADKYENKIR